MKHTRWDGGSKTYAYPVTHTWEGVPKPVLNQNLKSPVNT